MHSYHMLHVSDLPRTWGEKKRTLKISDLQGDIDLVIPCGQGFPYSVRRSRFFTFAHVHLLPISRSITARRIFGFCLHDDTALPPLLYAAVWTAR